MQIFGGAIPGTDHVLVHETATPTADYSTARLTEWNAVTGEFVRELPLTLPAAPTSDVGMMAFNRDASVAAVVVPILIPSRDYEPCCGSLIATVDLLTGQLLATAELTQVDPSAGAAFTQAGELVLRSFGAVDVLWLDPTTLNVVGTGPPGRRMGTGGGLAVLADDEVVVSWADRMDIYDSGSRGLLRSIPIVDDIASYGVTAVPSGMIATGPGGMALMDAEGRRQWTQPQSFTCLRAIAVPGSDSFLCPDPDTHEFNLADGTSTGRVFSAQSQWVIGGSVLADGSLAVVNQRTTASVQRFPLDGSGPMSSLVAAGKVATDGFADDRTLVVAERQPSDSGDAGNVETLWDVVSDGPVGSGAAAIDVVDRSVVARWSIGSSVPVLSDISGSKTWALTGAVFDQAVRVSPVSGARGGRAFAINSDVIIPLDPGTGREMDPALDFTGKSLEENWTMVHEVPGQDRAVVSWWDGDESRMITAVYDLNTGKELARGLYGDTASVVLPDGDVISTSSSAMRRSDGLLTPLHTFAKPVAGANHFELSDDGTTLLLQGAKGSTALYDTATGIKLGADIVADSPLWEPAHLSPNGQILATNVSTGVMIWNLDPDSFTQAACLMAGRDLTESEWRRYVGDAPQVKLCEL